MNSKVWWLTLVFMGILSACKQQPANTGVPIQGQSGSDQQLGKKNQ
jgi:hypothetical protein